MLAGMATLAAGVRGSEHADRLLRRLLFSAIALSVVHYGDNWINFDRYPTGDTGPQPTQDSIWIAWILFTAAGVAGYVLYTRRRRLVLASLLIAYYSLSGLISLGHYTAPGMSRLAWWRHVFIWVDIALGAAILAFALWSVANRDRLAEPG